MVQLPSAVDGSLPEILPRSAFPADRHPALVYLARLAPSSRRTMRTALDRIAALLTRGRCDAVSLDWPALRYQHTTAVRSRLSDEYEPATANRHLAALRGVLKEVWRLGYVDAEVFHRAADLPSVRGETVLRGRALTAGEIRQLTEVCAADLSPAGARDAAMIGLGAIAGLRRAEVIALDVADYDFERAMLTVRLGKGRKQRRVPVIAGVADALADWLKARGQAPGSLFCPVRGKAIAVRPMIPHAFHKICAKRARQAGLKPFTPHDLRRSAASELLDAGADLGAVQRLLGHANVRTTLRYDRRPEHATRKAAELLHFPWARRASSP
jgi:integrase/recombinase XerD